MSPSHKFNGIVLPVSGNKSLAGDVWNVVVGDGVGDDGGGVVGDSVGDVGVGGEGVGDVGVGCRWGGRRRGRWRVAVGCRGKIRITHFR